MRVLGIDYGGVRVGLALGDTETGIASAWSVLIRASDKQIADEIRRFMVTESLERVIVGIPKPLADQGRETEQTERVRQFVATLRQIGLSVEEFDETWSSSLAAKQGIEAGSKGKRDDLAAANILQGWLDRYALHP